MPKNRRRIHVNRPVLLLLAVATLVTSCSTPNLPYWAKMPAKHETSNRKVVVTEPREIDPRFHPNLCVVEFDEQGDLWTEAQVNVAIKALNTTTRPPLLLVYIHGWQNNAHRSNGDLLTFNDMLKRLASNRQIQATRTVFGVFIGWRAASYWHAGDITGIGWIARQLSFYSRKAATDRMAGVPLTQTLFTLAKTAKQRKGNSVLIGHSFGGRILERAVGQALLGQVSTTEQNYARPPADMILLINPATEALYSRQLKMALKKWPMEAAPAVVSLTSETDDATGFIWRTGTTVSTAFGGFRTYPTPVKRPDRQRSYVTSTSGHNDNILTHRILARPTLLSTEITSAFDWNLKSATETEFLVSDAKRKTQAYLLESLYPDKGKGDFIVPVGGYWVISVPGQILEGHGGVFKEGGIFSPRVVDVFSAFYKIVEDRRKSEPLPKVKVEIPGTRAVVVAPQPLADANRLGD